MKHFRLIQSSLMVYKNFFKFELTFFFYFFHFFFLDSVIVTRIDNYSRYLYRTRTHAVGAERLPTRAGKGDFLGLLFVHPQTTHTPTDCSKKNKPVCQALYTYHYQLYAIGVLRLQLADFTMNLRSIVSPQFIMYP